MLKAILLGAVVLNSASNAIAQNTCSFCSATQAFEQLLSAQSLPGGAMLIGNGQGIFLERYFGSYNASTVV